jgi:hypothetical protein
MPDYILSTYIFTKLYFVQNLFLPDYIFARIYIFLSYFILSAHILVDYISPPILYFVLDSYIEL